MKLLRKEIEKDGPGSAIMIAEQPEDMWHLYNLMGHGDCVRSKTFRKVRAARRVPQRCCGVSNLCCRW